VPQIAAFSVEATCRISSVRRVWSRLWSFQVHEPQGRVDHKPNLRLRRRASRVLVALRARARRVPGARVGGDRQRSSSCCPRTASHGPRGARARAFLSGAVDSCGSGDSRGPVSGNVPAGAERPPSRPAICLALKPGCD
jgi:hypothetical protein